MKKKIRREMIFDDKHDGGPTSKSDFTSVVAFFSKDRENLQKKRCLLVIWNQ